MSGHLPAFLFYPKDWLMEPSLARCSLAAKGVWIEMLCVAFNCEECGVFATGGKPWPIDEIAGAVRGDKEAVRLCIEELLAKGVAHLDSRGAVCSRRMVRDEQARKEDAARKRSVRSLSRECPPLVRPLSVPPDGTGNGNEIGSESAPSGGKLRPDSALEVSGAGAREKCWDRNAAVAEIVAAFPPGNGHASPKAVRDALFALGGLSGDSRHASEPEAAAWLLGRVRAWAASPLCRTTPAKFRLSMARWMSEGAYDTPDAAWAREYADDAAAKESPVQRALREAKGAKR